MRGCTVLLLFLFLCEELPAVTTMTYTAAEGEDITVKCQLHESGRIYMFCKNDCNDKEDVLVKTSGNIHENGRYSLRYEEKSKIMYMSIKKVQMSDSGWYWCCVKRQDSFYDYKEFWIKVTKAALTTSTTAVSTAQSPGSLLYLGLTVAVTLLLFSVALMIFYCNKRKNKPKQRPENTESAEVQECDREYDEIPEEQVQGRSTDCSSVIYSLASAPAQTQTENLVDPEHYSVVEFSRNSAPHSRTEAVVYSAVRTKETLYSTVSKPQQ